MSFVVPPTQAANTILASTTLDQMLTDLGILYGDAAWTVIPSYSGSWTSVSGAPAAAYRKIGTRVYLRGQVVGTATGTIFTLPAGYRPQTLITGATVANSAVATIQVQTNGAVQLFTGSFSPWLSLDPISFDTI